MNVCILGDAMVMQRWNDEKVVNHSRAKTQHKHIIINLFNVYKY